MRTATIFLNSLKSIMLAWVLAAGTLAQAADTASQILFTNVNVWDGRSEKLAIGMNVLVEDNMVKTISPRSIAASRDTRVIDGNPLEDASILADYESNIRLLELPSDRQHSHETGNKSLPPCGLRLLVHDDFLAIFETPPT